MEKTEHVYNQTRLTYIDLAKGFAILMVVAGHLAQYCLNGASAKNVFNFIYSFHMPLFFFLSGYVASLSRNRIKKGNILPFFIKKLKSLLLPFLVWGIVIYLLFQRHLSFEDSVVRVVQVMINPSNNAPCNRTLDTQRPPSLGFLSICACSFLRQETDLQILTNSYSIYL